MELLPFEMVTYLCKLICSMRSFFFNLIKRRLFGEAHDGSNTKKDKDRGAPGSCGGFAKCYFEEASICSDLSSKLSLRPSSSSSSDTCITCTATAPGASGECACVECFRVKWNTPRVPSRVSRKRVRPMYRVVQKKEEEEAKEEEEDESSYFRSLSRPWYAETLPGKW